MVTVVVVEIPRQVAVLFIFYTNVEIEAREVISHPLLQTDVEGEQLVHGGVVAASKVGKQGRESNGVLVAAWLNRKGYMNRRTMPATKKKSAKLKALARMAKTRARTAKPAERTAKIDR